MGVNADVSLGKGGEGTNISGNMKKIGIEGHRPRQCVQKTKEIPSLEIKSKGLWSHIQYVQNHDLIGKFVGIWPSKKSLIWWINVTWKPQGHYDLKLGEKGFFTVIFVNPEDINQVFEGGPSFFNSTGLYLLFW
jgi:hypothetical protein